jgi:hypothetical protein
MFEDFYKKITFLNNARLTNEEFAFAQYINISKEHGDKTNERFNIEFKKYHELNKDEVNYDKILQSLKQKGYITYIVKDGILKFADVVITEKFTGMFHIDMDSCWNEVKQIFPLQIYIQDKWIPAQTTKSRTLKEDYYELVTHGGDKFLHQEFIALTELFFYGTQTPKECNRKSSVDGVMGLERWIFSWDGIKEAIKEKEGIKPQVAKKILF